MNARTLAAVAVVAVSLACTSAPPRVVPGPACDALLRLAISDPGAAAWMAVRKPYWTDERHAIICTVHAPALADPAAALAALQRIEGTAWRRPLAVFLAREAGLDAALSNTLVATLQSAPFPPETAPFLGPPAWEYRRRPLPGQSICEGMTAASRRVRIDTAGLRLVLETALGTQAGAVTELLPR